uniref:THAP-type domain-containing protein n=1 Tax=Megaselia scalaris TaxID=36166 RepID=T1GPH4_MEGSC
MRNQSWKEWSQIYQREESVPIIQCSGSPLIKMVGCSVQGCKSSQYNSRPENGGKKKHFFRFPKLRKDICDIWVERCRKEKINIGTAKICHLHFTKDDFILLYYNKVRLKEDAIPTLNLPVVPKLEPEEEIFLKISSLKWERRTCTRNDRTHQNSNGLRLCSIQELRDKESPSSLDQSSNMGIT